MAPCFSNLNSEFANTKLLYATSARIGGSGLDSVAHESLRAAEAAGLDWRALAFDLRAADLPSRRVRNLRRHPVRLFSWVMGSEFYYGAKKQAIDRAAAVELERFGSAAQPRGHGAPPLIFHGWSGECVRSLRVCRRLGIPSIVEIPTWHRHKGKPKPDRLTKSERERAAATGWDGFKNRMLITRQQVTEEYDLADRLLVLSEKAEETFLAAGVPLGKLFRHQRGVDIDRFTPAAAFPEKFRALFVGALIERKGVHHLIDAWRRLALNDAELRLVGTVHSEIKPLIGQPGAGGIYALGFSPKVEELYRDATVHVLPSECEGSAKCTYEAAACGLPQIVTRESGDVVQDGVNGLIIPPNDPEAIAVALRRLHGDRELCARLGAAGRQRVVENFTWAHFRQRLLEAYRSVQSGHG